MKTLKKNFLHTIVSIILVVLIGGMHTIQTLHHHADDEISTVTQKTSAKSVISKAATKCNICDYTYHHQQIAALSHSPETQLFDRTTELTPEVNDEDHYTIYRNHFGQRGPPTC